MDIAPQAGDRVRLIAVPDWLLKDLPKDEQCEIRSYVGSTTTVTEVDAHGYFWVGFGNTVEDHDDARYGGHSFCVPRDCLELV
jgi:hypothetical protein